MVEKISPQVQEQIAQYQSVQQQIQVTTAQKLQIMAKVKEKGREAKGSADDVAKGN